MAKYVVAGVTGRVGSTVASELLKQGERVTLIVRDEARGLGWARRGAEVARGSLDDRSFMSHLLRDTAGFFTLLPENVAPDDFHGARRRMADAIAGAVHDSGVPHVVMLSAIAAVLPDGNGPAKDLHYCENRLRACGATFTASRVLLPRQRRQRPHAGQTRRYLSELSAFRLVERSVCIRRKLAFARR
jgi:uncharacterized protein YbjT (DUF2867 family)